MFISLSARCSTTRGLLAVASRRTYRGLVVTSATAAPAAPPSNNSMQQQDGGGGGGRGGRGSRRGGGGGGGGGGRGNNRGPTASPGHLGGGRTQPYPAGGGSSRGPPPSQQQQQQRDFSGGQAHGHAPPHPHPREPHASKGAKQQQYAPQHAAPQQQQAVNPAMASALSGVTFASMGLHPTTLSGLHDVFGYEEAFMVQAQACPPALKGLDVLAKAKTGTGKTLAFLIPIAEHLAAQPPPPVGGAIRALVLAPTRELTAQIKAEAVKLLTPHGAKLGVQMVIGGTNINRERSSLNQQRADLLIATPGRLQDHIDSTPGFTGRLWGVQILVMDEADRLLDMGFKPAIEAILSHLPPPSKRQSLMFSATIPQGVSEVARVMLRNGYATINTVTGEDRPSHESITQEVMSVPPEQLFPGLMAVINAHMAAEPNYKVIVFLPTARAAQFHAALARAAGCDALDLHSRLSQKQRDNAAAAFGSRPAAVIFASDVIARGLDFPDVSLVVQVGLTDPTQYEHRVGRTGRAGKEGEALLLLADDEARLLPALSAFPIRQAGAHGGATAAGRVLVAAQAHHQGQGQGGQHGAWGPWEWPGLPRALQQVASDSALLKSGEQAYIATLGFLAGKAAPAGLGQE